MWEEINRVWEKSKTVPDVWREGVQIGLLALSDGQKMFQEEMRQVDMQKDRTRETPSKKGSETDIILINSEMFKWSTGQWNNEVSICHLQHAAILWQRCANTQLIVLQLAFVKTKLPVESKQINKRYRLGLLNHLFRPQSHCWVSHFAVNSIWTVGALLV